MERIALALERIAAALETQVAAQEMQAALSRLLLNGSGGSAEPIHEPAQANGRFEDWRDGTDGFEVLAHGEWQIATPAQEQEIAEMMQRRPAR